MDLTEHGSQDPTGNQKMFQVQSAQSRSTV